MYKRLLPLALLFSSSMFGQVVRDTIWQDKFNFPTTEEKAVEFTVYTTTKNSKLLDIEIFNVETKKLVQKGKGTRDSSDQVRFEGTVQEFDKTGKKLSLNFYTEGELTKMTSYHPTTNEEFVMEFQNGTPYNGKVVQDYDNAFVYVEAKDGIFEEYYVFNPKNIKNKLVYHFDENTNIIDEEYFDATGKSTYKAMYENSSVVNGTSVALNYTTFTVSSIVEYVDGKLILSTDFFTTGKVRATHEVKGDVTTSIYFDPTGKQLSSYILKANQTTYEIVEDGANYMYNDAADYPDLLSSINTYKNNAVAKSVVYKIVGDKNYIDYISYYNESYPTKVEYYNENGSLKSVLTYQKDSYSPADGTLYEDNTTTTYKNGIAIDTKVTYDNGKVFKQATATQATFYDKAGKELGKATFKIDEDGYARPIQGTFYELFADELYSKTNYNNGNIDYDATYQNKNGKAILAQENFYKNETKVKTITYYSNGKKQQEDIYSNSNYLYEPITSTFFDKSGKLLGTYDAIKQSGTKYEFYDADNIKLISKYNDGNLTYTKQFESTTSELTYSEEPLKYYLQSEIDYNKQGKFYDKEGKLLSTATYKNGQPYNGKVIISDSFENKVVNYINGQKDGVEITTSSYDDSLTEKTYYKNGSKQKEEYYASGAIYKILPYVNDLIEGDALFYDTEGEILSTLTYKEGIPMDGESITADYENITKQVYVDGIITATSHYTYDDYTPIIEEVRIGEDAVERKIYNEEGIVIYQYEMLANKLHGAYKYFEKGKVKYQAELNDGKLASGSIVLSDLKYNSYSSYDYNESTPTYTVLTASKKSTKIQKFDTESNKSVFEMDTKIKKGATGDNPIINSVIEPMALYPSNNFNTDYASSY